MAIIGFDHLSHRVHDRYILHDINLSFSAEGLTVILGANGSGKTMLARHALALTRPTHGHITVHGTKLNRNNIKILRSSVGLVFQESERQFIGQTIEEELQFGLEGQMKDPDAIKEHLLPVLERFHFLGREKEHPFQLSGGEKRRLAIASIYAMKPELIFIDEPFYALDFAACRLVVDALLDLRNAGSGLVVITHAYHYILAHADRVILLNKGRIIYDGEPASCLPMLEEMQLQPARGALEDMTCV